MTFKEMDVINGATKAAGELSMVGAIMISMNQAELKHLKKETSGLSDFFAEISDIAKNLKYLLESAE